MVLQKFRILTSLLDGHKVSFDSTSLIVYRCTAIAVMALCIFVSSFQYFGDPIRCVQDKKDEEAAINERVMNAFCFISSTYTVTGDRLGYDDGAYPGVKPNQPDGNVTRYTYYVWIPFVLFVQALTFLSPNLFWSYCEGGLLQQLIAAVSGSDITRKRTDGVSTVCGYFRKRLNSYGTFASAWVFYDVIGCVITVANFGLTDGLLGGRFLHYGFNVLGFRSDDRYPVDELFPKMTKCTFYKFGAGGSLQNFDALCVMALNVVNEKIYVILWFWFFFVLLVSAVCFLVKIGVVLWLRCANSRAVFARRWFAYPAVLTAETVRTFDKHFTASDWVFFRQLTVLMDTITCREFVACLMDLLRNGS